MFRFDDKYGYGLTGFFHWIGAIPRYTETTLFLTSLTFTLLYFSNEEFTAAIYGFAFSGFDPRSILMLFVFFSGLLYPFYYAISDKTIPHSIKSLILTFVVFTNIGVALCAASYALKTVEEYLLIFPAMNILNAIFLFIMLRANIINESCIADENARPHELVIGSLALLLIFAFSQYVMHYYWAITFSICLTYSSMINDFATRLFFKE